MIPVSRGLKRGIVSSPVIELDDECYSDSYKYCGDFER